MFLPPADCGGHQGLQSRTVVPDRLGQEAGCARVQRHSGSPRVHRGQGEGVQQPRPLLNRTCI